MLNKARDDAGKQAQGSLNWTNNVVRMVTAGAGLLASNRCVECRPMHEPRRSVWRLLSMQVCC